MDKIGILWAGLLLFFTSVQAQQRPGVNLDKEGSLCLDFGSCLESTGGKEVYTIQRAKGRLGFYETIGTTSNRSYTDRQLDGSPYDYYYRVLDRDTLVATLSLETELLGEHTLIYRPTDNQAQIAQEVNGVHDRMFGQEFSPHRYAVLFKPGDYKAAGLLKVPFYVQIAGLGKTPYEVELSNVHTPPHLADGNGTCTFWRSAENFAVIGPETYREEDTFKWAVSQAAPLRRIYSTRVVRHQWANGWVSGGYTADCYFESAVGSKNQQQWYTRNTHLNKGRGAFEEIKYNYCFQGVTLGPEVDQASYQNNWAQGGNVTRIATTPVIREKPFLFIGGDGRYKVFRPALKRDRIGVSYTRQNMGEGEEIDLLDAFFVAKPGVSAVEINRQMSKGKHVLFTPGMYELDEPLRVTHANTILLGLGLATLIPGVSNAETAISIDDVDGVTVASLMFDAHYSSHSLLQVGRVKTNRRHRDNPVLLADLFFRVGGFRAAKVHVGQTVVLNSNDVIGDHFWIWRADHGVRGSVGWDINTAANGLVVTGDHVTLYALFNEHFQEYQTLWMGDHGRTFFFQCESPYDAPHQEAYRSESGAKPGYAAYKVANDVDHHEAYAFGIYDVLINEIAIESSIEVPEGKPGIRLKHICNNSLSNGPNRGFNYVINRTEKSTYNTWRDNRAYIVDFKAKKNTK